MIDKTLTTIFKQFRYCSNYDYLTIFFVAKYITYMLKQNKNTLTKTLRIEVLFYEITFIYTRKND